MTRDTLKTLFHPFEADALPLPAAGERVLFLGAEPGFRLPEGFSPELTLVQGFRPWFKPLEASESRVTPLPEGEGYDAALVLCGRHRGANEIMIAEALERVRAGALVLVAGSKDDGIASLRKRVDELLTVEGQMPKHHGLAFWFRRPDEAGAAVERLRAGNGERLLEGRFVTAPGMFSADEIDAGSRLLVENLPDKVYGAVADFCAGWGYIAAELADRFPKMFTLDLYEADFCSLEAAKRNLAATGSMQKNFFWHDLQGEPVSRRYDFVFMNPPFHQRRAAEPDIGQGMIKAAAAALKPGGRLIMVANRQLPYEKSISAAFSDQRELARTNLFKVLSARR